MRALQHMVVGGDAATAADSREKIFTICYVRVKTGDKRTTIGWVLFRFFRFILLCVNVCARACLQVPLLFGLIEIHGEIFSTIFFELNSCLHYVGDGHLSHFWISTKACYAGIKIGKNVEKSSQRKYFQNNAPICRLAYVSNGHKLLGTLNIFQIAVGRGGLSVHWRVNLKCVKFVLNYAIVLKFPFDWTLNFDYGKSRILFHGIDRAKTQYGPYVCECPHQTALFCW